MIVKYAEAATFLNDATLAADVNFQTVVDAAIAFVQGWCGRTFDFGARTTTVQGTDIIVLNEPIATITEIRNDATGAFDATTIETDLTPFVIEDSDDTGRIRWTDYAFLARPTYLRIVWQGGYYEADDVTPGHDPKMPADLRLATFRIIESEWRSGGGPTYQSERLGEYSYTRANARQSFPYDDKIAALLEKYQVVV